MTFDLFTIDCWKQERIYGFSLLTFEFENSVRCILSFNLWADKEWNKTFHLDLFWIHILSY